MSVIIFCYLGTIIIFLVVTNLFLLNLFLISNHYSNKMYEEIFSFELKCNSSHHNTV